MSVDFPLVPETVDNTLLRYGHVPMIYTEAVRHGEAMAFLANARDEREGMWRDYEPEPVGGGMFVSMIAWLGVTCSFPIYCVDCGMRQDGHADNVETSSGIICEKCK